MKRQKIDPAVTRRRTLIRVGLLVVYLGVTALFFIMGKGHTILVDNKDVEDGKYPAVDGVTVVVDRQEELELYPGDRDKFEVKSQKHRVTAEAIDGSVKVEKTFSLPLGQDMMLLSVPKLLAGVEPFIEPFKPLEEPDSNDEAQGGGEAFTSPGGDIPPGTDAPPAVPAM